MTSVLEEERLSVFHFGAFSNYLSYFIETEKKRNSRFSIAIFARRCGLKSVSLVSMIASGSRIPTQNVLLSLLDVIKLKGNERAYATALVGLARAKSEVEKKHFEELLLAARPQDVSTDVSLDDFEFISNWYHSAILSMFNLRDCTGQKEWFCERLGFLVDEDTVSKALARMESLGIVKRNNGIYERIPNVVRSTRNVPSIAIRNFHRQVLIRASNALSQQKLDERYFISTSFAVEKAKIKEVQDAVSQFANKMMTDFQSNRGDEVYTFSSQFFRVSVPRAVAK